jgi:hypothetical protein
VRSALPRPGAGEERGEVAGGLGVGGGEPGRERQLVDAGARREVREFGEQRGWASRCVGSRSAAVTRAAGSA